MRLIDAEKLKCEIDWYEPDADRIIRRYIDRQETVDAKPVIHAKWINKKGKIKCSNCDSFARWKQGTGGWWKMDDSKFCHNCGAKMDGE